MTFISIAKMKRFVTKNNRKKQTVEQKETRQARRNRLEPDGITIEISERSVERVECDLKESAKRVIK